MIDVLGPGCNGGPDGRAVLLQPAPGADGWNRAKPCTAYMGVALTWVACAPELFQMVDIFTVDADGRVKRLAIYRR